MLATWQKEGHRRARCQPHKVPALPSLPALSRILGSHILCLVFGLWGTLSSEPHALSIHTCLPIVHVAQSAQILTIDPKDSLGFFPVLAALAWSKTYGLDSGRTYGLARGETKRQGKACNSSHFVPIVYQGFSIIECVKLVLALSEAEGEIAKRDLSEVRLG